MHSNVFDTEHENAFPFPSHIDNSIPTFTDMSLHLII